MDNNNGITPVMPVGGSDGFGGNNFMWLFGLIFLGMMFNNGWGGFGNNGFANAIGYENLATSNEVQRGFDNQNQTANQREILSAVNSGTAQAVAATNQTFHDNLQAMQSLYNELQRDAAANAVSIANLAGDQQKCCCDTKLLIAETGAEINAGIADAKYSDALNTAGINANIAQSRYDTQLGVAAINANTTAQMQKILDVIQQNKIEGLQAQVSQLQLAQATNGMLRFPNSWSYGAGPFPPIFGNCACAGV